MGEPQVSVIVATYNRSRVLKRALASVLAQDMPDLEVWVIGDGCTDDSAGVVAELKDSRVHWINLPANSGTQSVPNNEGLKRARGEFVAYLGHDDLWFPWHLSTLLEGLNGGKADFAHGLISRSGPEGCRSLQGAPDNLDYGQFFIPPSCWLYRREWAEKNGPWKDAATIPLPVDREYLNRLVRLGARFTHADRLTVLKYPSPWFDRAYANLGTPPQEEASEAMTSDPLALERRVLTTLALRSEQQDSERAPKSLPAALASWLLDLWGRHRWPVSALLLHRFQNQRSAFRRRRGLST